MKFCKDCAYAKTCGMREAKNQPWCNGYTSTNARKCNDCKHVAYSAYLSSDICNLRNVETRLCTAWTCLDYARKWWKFWASK